MSRVHNWLIFQVVNPIIHESIRKYASGTLIDIGCGEKPYAVVASKHVTSYIGIDFPGTLHSGNAVDLYATAYETGLQSSICDTVLCTYALEHLEEPNLAIAEAARILKDGGMAIYTVPLFWHLHEEPRDFYRYTKYGLRYLFEKNGFKIIELRAMTGFWVTFLQELVYYLWGLRSTSKLNPLWWSIPPFTQLLQGIGYFLRNVDQSERYTCEYLVVAQKCAKSPSE
jgi:SAM-dependent methyltransferase